MRILMVNKFLYNNGGSETYIFKLSEYLERTGHEVSFFGMRDDRNIVTENKELMVSNVDFHGRSLKKVFYPFKIIYSREAREKIGKVIKEFKPDIVHLNNYNFQITPSIIYEIKKYHIPIVQTIHDPMLICPSHSLYNFSHCFICEKCKGKKYYNCFFSKCMFNSYTKSLIGTLEAYLYSTLNTYKYISRFICPSKFMADKLIEFGVDKTKIKVLHNFCDKRYIDQKYNKKDYILYFGRLSTEKGIKTLLEAVGTLKNIKFIIAGRGPLENCLDKIDNVDFVGFKSGDGLNRLIGESLFTIYPSEWYENCPMSVLESQALGTPVIGSDIGGIPELIENNISGLLFEPGNHASLIEKIEFLYNNRNLLEEFSNRCVEHVNKFSIDNYLNLILQVYSDAINVN